MSAKKASCEKVVFFDRLSPCRGFLVLLQEGLRIIELLVTDDSRDTTGNLDVAVNVDTKIFSVGQDAPDRIVVIKVTFAGFHSIFVKVISDVCERAFAPTTDGHGARLGG